MVDVIPAPRHVSASGGHVRFASGVVDCANPILRPVVERFCADVARRTVLRLEPSHHWLGAAASPSVRVELGYDPVVDALPQPIGVSPWGDRAPDERYSLAILPAGVLVRALEPVGVARALTTLLQLLATATGDTDGAVVLPILRLHDAPRFAWRGLTLDVVRTFFPSREIARVIDLLALYKLNVLHLHLTDDEAWRIEAGRPRNRRSSDRTFYSNAELRELVRYAEERFVTIVPEVDAPGHVRTLVHLQPALMTGRNLVEFTDEADIPHRSAWLDPELPATYRVIEKVLTDVAELFPGEYLHIGGDEPFGMPEELYLRYVSRMRPYALSLGKRTIGFQETVRAVADPSHVIQYWIHFPPQKPSAVPAKLSPDFAEKVLSTKEDVARALEHSVPMVLSPMTYCYLDVPYAEPSADPGQELVRKRLGLRARNPRTTAEMYDWEPATLLGVGAEDARIAGVGAAVWCDTIKSFADLTFMLLPRLAGIAQKGWGEPGRALWADHRLALAVQSRLWDQDGLTWFKSSTVDWTRPKLRLHRVG
jgi:hexosaminidase